MYGHQTEDCKKHSWKEKENNGCDQPEPPIPCRPGKEPMDIKNPVGNPYDMMQYASLTFGSVALNINQLRNVMNPCEGRGYDDNDAIGTAGGGQPSLFV